MVRRSTSFLSILSTAIVIMATVLNSYGQSVPLVAVQNLRIHPDQQSPIIHTFTGLPLTTNGWTDFKALLRDGYKDSRVIFVSSSKGNDSTGKVYSVSDLAFDENGMFQPIGQINAYKTISEGYAKVRNGYPDILLLKRGDEWAAGLGSYARSGRSVRERHIIASYGTGDRPQLFEVMLNARNSSYLIVSGLRFYANDWRTAGRAIDVTGIVTHQLYEDLRLHQHSKDKIQGGTINNVALRRCTFTNYQGHDGFIYAANVTGLMLEENIFSEPWQKGSPDESRHGRHLYLCASEAGDGVETLKNVILHGNIFYRGEREGVDIRSGGIIDNNLIIQNDSTYVGGRGGSEDSIHSAKIINNVFLEGPPNINGPNNLIMANIDGGVISGNIWTDGTNLGGSANTINIVGSKNVNIAKNLTVSDNIIYNFSISGGRAIAISSSLQEVEDIIIRNNELQYTTTSSEIILHRAWSTERFKGFTYSGNKYFSTTGAANWFIPGGTMAGWIKMSGETGAKAIKNNYPDASRNIKTYNAMLGGGASTEAFMAEVLKQSRYYWRSEYSACKVNNYIRSGFGKAPVQCTSH